MCVDTYKYKWAYSIHLYIYFSEQVLNINNVLSKNSELLEMNVSELKWDRWKVKSNNRSVRFSGNTKEGSDTMGVYVCVSVFNNNGPNPPVGTNVLTSMWVAPVPHRGPRCLRMRRSVTSGSPETLGCPHASGCPGLCPTTATFGLQLHPKSCEFPALPHLQAEVQKDQPFPWN